MKNFIRKNNSLFVSIVMIIGAIFLFINRNNIDVVEFILGLILIGIGIAKLFPSFFEVEKNLIGYTNFGQGILFLICGILILIFGNFIIDFIFYIIGSALIFLGVIKLIKYFLYKKTLIRAKINSVVEGTLFILGGLMCIVINVSAINRFIVVVIAIMLIVTALFNLYRMIKVKIYTRAEPESASSKNVHGSIDAEIINEREE